MGTKIDHDKLYKIQTYSFHDAVITVTEAFYSRTEVDPPTKPNKWGHTPSPTVHADGSEHYYKYTHWEEAIAVEAEWHEIPSLKAMLYEDAVTIKDKLSELDQGVFVTVKDALKKVLPHQYAFLKELKDILHDRNSVRDL